MNTQVAIRTPKSLFLPPDINRRLRRTWRSLSRDPVRVQIVCCTDAEIARLNRQYRGRRGPTDVLTFVYGAGSSGDIFIALGVARRQAHERKVTLADEFCRLAVHGLAHLSGYDHHTRDGFMTMRKKEFEALVQIL